MQIYYLVINGRFLKGCHNLLLISCFEKKNSFLSNAVEVSRWDIRI